MPCRLPRLVYPSLLRPAAPAPLALVTGLTHTARHRTHVTYRSVSQCARTRAVEGERKAGEIGRTWVAHEHKPRKSAVNAVTGTCVKAHRYKPRQKRRHTCRSATAYGTIRTFPPPALLSHCAKHDLWMWFLHVAHVTTASPPDFISS